MLEELYAEFQELNWCTFNPRGYLLSQRQDEIDEDFKNAYFTQYPKRKKWDSVKVRTEHENSEWFQEVLNKWRTLIEVEAEKASKRHRELFDQLFVYDVSNFKPLNEFHECKRAGTHNYSTQTQPHFYAKGELLKMQNALENLGYTVKIEYEPLPDYNHIGYYVLLANAKPAVAFCAELQNYSYKLPAVYNMKVYYPHLRD